MSVCDHVPLDIKIVTCVDVVGNRDMQCLCAAPYPNHKHGCPNYGKKDGCPPNIPYFPDVYDTEGVHLIAQDIQFGEYLRLFKIKHPTWTDRQLRNPLYWQTYFRARFRASVEHRKPDGYDVLYTPEAMGVDVTATCKKAGINLEWPPTEHTFMVALYARRR